MIQVTETAAKRIRMLMAKQGITDGGDWPFDAGPVLVGHPKAQGL